MKLTPAEAELIKSMRANKVARFSKYAKPIVDTDGEPTGKLEMAESVLEKLLDDMNDKDRELSVWARHTCAGEEA